MAKFIIRHANIVYGLWDNIIQNAIKICILIIYVLSVYSFGCRFLDMHFYCRDDSFFKSGYVQYWMRATAGAMLLVLAFFAAPSTGVASEMSSPTIAETRRILERAVSFQSVAGNDDRRRLADFLADELRAGGFQDEDIRINMIEGAPTLIAKYEGRGERRPIILLAHMDVVGARDSEWTSPPFVVAERDGFLFGRGVLDNKLGVAALVAVLADLKRAGFKPDRDIFLALTGDEETAMRTSEFAASQVPDAAYVLNADSGGGVLGDDGSAMSFAVQAAEKVYVDFRLSLKGPGGHSARPTADTVAYELARAVTNIAGLSFAPRANELTRSYLRSVGSRQSGALGRALLSFADDPTDPEAAAIISQYPAYVGQIRTTCVVTRFSAGHANNALPQTGEAIVNCRLFPGDTVAEVEAALRKAIDNRSIELEVLGRPIEAPASPLRDDVMAAVRAAVDRQYPDVSLTPLMSVGQTDSAYFRAAGLPSYGVRGVFIRPGDNKAHGADERIPVNAVAAEARHWRDLITLLASGQ